MASASFPRRLLGKLPSATFGPSFATLSSNATIQLAAFAGSVLVARRLGVDIRGEYAGAAAWCSLLSALCDFGVSQGVPYRCARSPLAPGATIGTGLAFATAAGTGGALVGLLAALLILAPFKPQLAAATTVFLPSIPLMLILTYAAVAAQGLGLVRTYNAIRIAASVATLVGITIAVLLPKVSGATLTGCIVGVQVLATALSLFLLHRRASARGWRVEAEEMRHLWRFGTRTYLGNLAWVANSKLDQMIMSVALTSRDLGLYSIAVSFAGLVFALASATTDANFSRLAADISVAERLRRIRTAIRRNAKVSVAVGLVLAAVGFPLLPLVFGPEFAASALPAAILMLGGVLLGLNYTLGVGLRANGHPIVTSIGEAGGLLVTAIGLPIAVLRYGIVAAAVVSVVSYAATSTILLLFSRRFAADAHDATVEAATA